MTNRRLRQRPKTRTGFSESHSRLNTDEFIRNYLISLDTIKAYRLLDLYQKGEHALMLSIECNPDSYSDPSEFRRDYAAVKLLSKATFLSLKLDTREIALNALKKREEVNRYINRSFRSPSFGYGNPKALHVLLHAKKIMARILGTFDVDEWFESCGWGPGATSALRRQKATYSQKFRVEREMTPLLATLVRDQLDKSWPGWFSNPILCIQECNKVTTVPKSAKTDRTIAMEPGLNGWFQKGLGEMIRRRLRRHGCDLDDQTRNQLLARQGSIDDSLATLDMTDASNSLCRDAVKWFLQPYPGERLYVHPGWLTALDCSRSHFGRIPGSDEPHLWEMFSSMGNGFTFELESLIFHSITVAVCEQLQLDTGYVAVYGDDIILPSAGVPLAVQAFGLAGFEINPSKSFVSGPFRESCGDHWYSGRNCKPLFLKKRLSSYADVYKTANRLRLNSHLWEDNSQSCGQWAFRVWSGLVATIPPSRRFVCSALVSLSGGFAVNMDEALASNHIRRPKSWIEGIECKLEVEVPKYWDYEEDNAPVLASLWMLEKRFGAPSVPFDRRRHLSRVSAALDRGKPFSKVRVKWVLNASWYDLGPWL